MIELANDPKASRSFPRAAANDSDAKGLGGDARRGRSGHAWPFLSRYAQRGSRAQDSDKPAAAENGS